MTMMNLVPVANDVALPDMPIFYQDPYQTLLPALLQDLQWKGEDRQINEALSIYHDAMDLQDFRDVMAHLGYASMLRFGAPRQLEQKLLPAMYMDKKGLPVLMRKADNVADFNATETTLVIFSAIALATDQNPADVSVKKTLQRFHPILFQALLTSFLIGLLALAPTLYNMALYDSIIPSGSVDELLMLFVGATLALGAEVLLRHRRNRDLGYFGARVDHFISCTVFERLLFLPPIYTERAPVSAQLARMRDFESVREFFTGPLATLFFEMPLIAIYLVAMFCIAGKLALIPIVLLGAYAGLIWLMDGRMKETARQSASAVSLRQDFLLEMLTKLSAIRLAGLEHVWQKRYRIISSDASIASFRASFQAQVLEVSSYVLMTLGGILTLSFGVVMVIDRSMTVGALIAGMMLIWRIVSPMQICCASMTRIQQMGASVRQVQKLLAMPPERKSALGISPSHIKGRVTFYRVSLRYTQEAEPALMGVSFEAKPGQIIAIKGDNGSGKSSILKLLLSLYQPQGGAVRLDGIDVRQFDALTLRQAIAYVPQHMELLPGTVRDNLLFAEPGASEEQCWEALRLARAQEEVTRLPQQLDTTVAGKDSEGISFMLKQRLNLARAYLRPAKIMLFDEASHSLGKENDLAFADMIKELRGKCTIILATHREDHMRMADQLLVLHKGELTHMGPPDQVLNFLRGKK